MPGLNGRFARGRRDRGGVTVLVAVLLAGGLLLGMGAYSLDLGTLYAEREQLISGANAAATAIAEQCGRPVPTTCNSSTGQPWANNNALSGAATVTRICGLDRVHGSLSTCPAATGKATDCVTTARANVSYAEVHTSSPASGSTALPAFFAGALVPGYTHGHVQACSRVAWGPPANADPIAISYADFQRIAGTGANLPAPYPNADAAYESVVMLQGVQAPNSGTGNGFSWINSTRCARLAVAINNGTNLNGLTDKQGGNQNAPNGCGAVLQNLTSSTAKGNYLLVPIYLSVQTTNRGTGDAIIQGIYGIAAFQVTGYRITGVGTKQSIVGGPTRTASTFCGSGGSQSQCLLGYFVGVNILDGTWPAAGRTLGATVLKTDG